MKKKIVFVSGVNIYPPKHPDLPRSTAFVSNDLLFRHWDSYSTEVPHPFVADFDGQSISNTFDILEGFPYSCPDSPFSGIEQISWSPDSTKIAYSCKKLYGKESALSTNANIYIFDFTTKETRNITGDNFGADTNPRFSTDGRFIAWLSMERDGYESDVNRLFVMNFATNEKIFLTKDFNSNVLDFVWSLDNQRIYFIGVWHGKQQVYVLTLSDQSFHQLTDGYFHIGSISIFINSLIVTRSSINEAFEIYSVDLESQVMKRLTYETSSIFEQIDLSLFEESWVETTDHKQMQVWIIHPPNFDPSKKYPALLYCQGGPQSPILPQWSYRWNFLLMASRGYIIVAPNRRGVPGFGQEWNEQISGDYGGQCMIDYLSAIDSVSSRTYVDSSKIGCFGASFGGFSVFWLAGHHEKRFRVFVSHAGLFNLESFHLETDELWFPNFDLKGYYWEKSNALAQKSRTFSPHLFVDKWDTPILCTHGEKDYRVSYYHSIQAYQAAILRGIEAQILLFPDECHWILKPQNAIFLQRTFFEWVDKYLK